MSTDVVPEISDSYNGCPIPVKEDTVVVAGGGDTTAEYTLTDGNGNAIDLTPWFPEGLPDDENPYGLGVWFSTADDKIVAKKRANAVVSNAPLGKFQIPLPPYVANVPGVYHIFSGVYAKEVIRTDVSWKESENSDITVVDGEGGYLYDADTDSWTHDVPFKATYDGSDWLYDGDILVDGGDGNYQINGEDWVNRQPVTPWKEETKVVVSKERTVKTFEKRCTLLVEWTPFMLHVADCHFPHKVTPTLMDIRRKLDDFAGKNDLMDQVEFSGDDIVNAIVHPVLYFNELGGHLRRDFTVLDFPYYEMWLTATASELLRIAVIHYMRNKLQSGGTAGDEKNRDRQYMELANLYWGQYDQWCQREKTSLKSIEYNDSRSGWGAARVRHRNGQFL